MNETLRLKEIAIILYLLVIPLVLYFKYFPTIVNSILTNVLFLVLVFCLAVLLIYGAFLIKQPLDIYLLLPQTLIIAFVLQAAPNLRLVDTFLQDPYFHQVTTINVLNFGVANPVLISLYDNIQTQLYWPVMHLLTATAVTISGIDVGLLFRFQEPFIGALFVLAVFVLAKLVLKNDSQAFLASLIALSSETLIFYQSEYHPQGLAFFFFVFVVYAYLKLKETNNRLIYGVFLIFLAALVLSHAFSSLFLGLFAASIVVTPFVLMHAPHLRPEFRKLLKEVSKDYTIWLLIAVSALAYHVLGYLDFASGLIWQVETAARAPQFLTIGGNVPLLYTASNAAQYQLLLLAVVSLVLTVTTQNITRVRCAVLTVAFVVLGFVGNYAGALPLDRTIGFYTPLGALFVAITAFSIKDQWFASINKPLKTGLLVALICVPLVAGVVNSQVPAFFFKNSQINPFYFSSNDLSSANRLNTTGTWINQHVDRNAIIAVEFDTLPAVCYFGERPNYQYNHTGVSAVYISDTGAQYAVVNPNIPYSENFNKTAYLDTINLVFDDGKLNVGQTNV
jgi:hypothetical protein